MLIKYFVETVIPFEDFKHSEIEQEVLKQMNEQYPSNNFILESIKLCGDKYYDTDKGVLFTGEAIAKITQLVPYGQEPKGDWFQIKYLGWGTKKCKKQNQQIIQFWDGF